MRNEFWKKDDKQCYVITGKTGSDRKTKVINEPDQITRRFQVEIGKAVNEMKTRFERVFVKKVFMYRRDDGQMGACVVSNIRVK